MQQTLTGCAFCDAPPGTETGEAHTWGQDERVTHPICVDCAIQTEPDPDERDHVACDGCGLFVDTLAALTRFRVELGHLEGPIQLCARCSPGGLTTYWTRDLELAQGTAYSYVNRLVDAGVVDVTDDEQPRKYTARKIDLTVTTTAGDREYTITPALIDAVGRRETDADIDTYIDRHGVAGLATALTYAIARERGEVTHRMMAEDLDISPLAAEIVLQALRPVVHEHYDIEEAGAGLDELDIDDGDAADDA